MANVQEEYLRIIQEVKGDRALADLQTALQQVCLQEEALKAQFQAQTITEEELTKKTERLAAAKAKLTAQVDGLKGGLKLLGDGSVNLGQGFQAAGYAAQDFASTSGSLGQKLNSISNNIPGILAGFGVGGPIGMGLAALSVAAIALYNNWDSLTRLFQEKTVRPEDTGLDALKRELERAKDGMAELEKRSSLTRDELERYHDLRRRVAETEEKISHEMERQALLKKFGEIVSPEEAEARTARSKAFQEAVGGRQNEIAQKIAELTPSGAIAEAQAQEGALGEQLEAERRELTRLGEQNVPKDAQEKIVRDLERKLQVARDKTKAALEKRRDDIRSQLAKVAEKGDLQAYEEFLRFLPQLGLGGSLEEGLRRAAPGSFIPAAVTKMTQEMATAKQKALGTMAQGIQKDQAQFAQDANQFVSKAGGKLRTRLQAIQQQTDQDAEATRKKDEATRKQAEDARKAEAHRLGEATGLELQAEQIEDIARSQGATPKQATAFAAQQIRPLLGASGRGPRGAAIAHDIAQEAHQGLDQRLMGVGLQSLGVQERFLAVGQQLDAELQALMMRQNIMAQQADQFFRTVYGRQPHSGRRGQP